MRLKLINHIGDNMALKIKLEKLDNYISYSYNPNIEIAMQRVENLIMDINSK